MTYRRLLITLAILFAIPCATACDWLDESCPEGYWRMRSGQPCVPLPDLDAGTDAGSTPADAGPADASVDAASPTDAATDGSAPSDAAADASSADASSADAATLDAAIDASVDAS